MQKQLDESEISYRELRKEGEMARKRLISAAESAAVASVNSISAINASGDIGGSYENIHRGMVRAVPTGNLISQTEAAARPFTAVQRGITRMSSHAPMSTTDNAVTGGNRGYQAPTLSSSANQMKAANSNINNDALNRTVDTMQQYATIDLSDSRNMTYGGASSNSNPQLRRDQVPKAVDIPVEDLNNILGAVGGLKTNTFTSGGGQFDSGFYRSRTESNNVRGGATRSGEDSISIDSLLLRRPPGGNPIGPPVVNTQDSSDSSLFSVERQLQHLVDIALDRVVVETKTKNDIIKKGLAL